MFDNNSTKAAGDENKLCEWLLERSEGIVSFGRVIRDHQIWVGKLEELQQG